MKASIWQDLFGLEQQLQRPRALILAPDSALSRLMGVEQVRAVPWKAVEGQPETIRRMDVRAMQEQDIWTRRAWGTSARLERGTWSRAELKTWEYRTVQGLAFVKGSQPLEASLEEQMKRRPRLIASQTGSTTNEKIKTDRLTRSVGELTMGEPTGRPAAVIASSS